MARMTDRLRQDAADRLKAITPLPLRRRLVKVRLGTRERTAGLRTLPDVLIIGAQRSGTSSLYKYLGRHPNVAPSLRKEIEYFSVDYPKGEEWYRAHFPLSVRRQGASALGRPFVTFEATPDYLFDPRAPARAQALVPGAKLIAMLREPVERAVSHYHHSVRSGLEDLDLETALRTEDERLEGEIERCLADPSYPAYPLRRYSYMARGRYAEQIERWLEHYPAEQVLVVPSADLFSTPAETFDRILEFIGLPSWHPPEFRNYSYVNALDGDYPEPPAAVRDYLRARFEEPNERLVALLGEEFRWDAQPAR